MGVLTYGVKFSCDLCHLQADGPPVTGDLRYDQLPVPEGWTNMNLLSIILRDAFAAPITYLCPACSGLTVGTLAERLNAQLKESVSRANGN